MSFLFFHLLDEQHIFEYSIITIPFTDTSKYQVYEMTLKSVRVTDFYIIKQKDNKDNDRKSKPQWSFFN